MGYLSKENDVGDCISSDIGCDDGGWSIPPSQQQHLPVLTPSQSLPLCCALAALGGLLEVGATAVTAVPSVREREGLALSPWVQTWTLVGNLSLQAIGSILSHLVATWFGPVSIVVPYFYAATLMANLLIFGVILGTEFFSKPMRVGSYVIVVAVILLPLVGPTVQENQKIVALFHHWYATSWFGLLLSTMIVACILLLLGGQRLRNYGERGRYFILLMARASAISVNLTVSRSFILGPSHDMMALFVVLKILSGCIYCFAIIVQATSVDQARFVPLNTTTIIGVNALTGIFIWEDWKVVKSWYGYACVFALLGLGCDLLLTVPLLHHDNPRFGLNKRATFLFTTNSNATTGAGFQSIPDVDKHDEERNRNQDDEFSELFLSSSLDHQPRQRSQSFPFSTFTAAQRENQQLSRKDAWKLVMSSTT